MPPALPPAIQLTKLITGCVATQIVAAAARLNLADHLHQRDLSGKALAEVVGADPQVLPRLLRGCVMLGLLRHTEADEYALTPMGALLCSGPDSLRSWAISWGGAPMYRTQERLFEAALTGRSGAEEVLGTDFWTYYRQHPDEWAHYADMMRTLSAECSEALVDAYDFTRYGRIADVGGGDGALLFRILSASPTSTGVLYDQEPIVARAREQAHRLGLTERVELIAGDFLAAVPGGADLYVIKSVFCDWDDEHAARLLNNCAEAAPAGSTLLIVDWVNGSQPYLPLNDLALLACTSGRVRSAEEFTSLLDTAGFEVVEIGTVNSRANNWNTVEARRR
jgi:SAM-dependent methyltransferase